MKAKIVGNVLTLELPIVKTPSKSGKNIVIASTGGNHVIEGLSFENKPVTIGLNAYVKP